MAKQRGRAVSLYRGECVDSVTLDIYLIIEHTVPRRRRRGALLDARARTDPLIHLSGLFFYGGSVCDGNLAGGDFGFNGDFDFSGELGGSWNNYWADVVIYLFIFWNECEWEWEEK